jgi:hypothetical protein
MRLSGLLIQLYPNSFVLDTVETLKCWIFAIFIKQKSLLIFGINYEGIYGVIL